jgi:hypothetical protein
LAELEQVADVDVAVAVEVAVGPGALAVGDVVILAEDQQVFDVDHAVEVDVAGQVSERDGEVAARAAVAVPVDRVGGPVGDAVGKEGSGVVAVGEFAARERGERPGRDVRLGVVGHRRAGQGLAGRQVSQDEVAGG